MAGINGHDGNENDNKIRSLHEARQKKILELKAANDVHEPAINLPTAVKFLSLALLLAYAPNLFLSDESLYEFLFSGGFVSARYTGGLPFGYEAVISPVTHMFLHSGFLHLSVNVITLMAFGAGLEREIGARKMLMLYFACGFAGALAHFAFSPDVQMPLVGASGAISGLFGGVLMMMYDNGVMGRGIHRLLPLIAIWIGISALFGFFGVPGSDATIGWLTHIGGFAAGLIFYGPIRRSKIL